MTFPTPLDAYPPLSPDGLVATLRDRLAIDPFNGVVTGIFALAVLHTFLVGRIAALANRGQPGTFRTEVLHFLAEVEVVFGMWAAVLGAAITFHAGSEAARHFLNDGVNYTEALFVVVIMAMSSTRPVILFAEGLLRKLAALGGATPAAWWFTILTVGPLLGSFITEPAAMAISALLLARQFFDLEPSPRLKYATLGLLFVNVSIGGTLTHFAAPPVLMVARVWDWDTPFMLGHFGWRSVIAILVANLGYLAIFWKEMRALEAKVVPPDPETPDEEAPVTERLAPVPIWVTIVHIAFIAWTVFNAHYPALFLAGFMFFLGFLRTTAPFQSRVELRTPLLVGFFLAGLVIHGSLQGWWITPVLGSLSQTGLFFGATFLTAFNDNALITYLATLAPQFGDHLKIAVVEGAVTGGGLTVIANAPNPAGQALLARFFGGTINPLQLAAAALFPTLLAIAAFRLI